MLATSRGWRRQFSHPEMQRPPASISGCNGSIRDVVDIFGCLRHPKMHEAIQDARSNSGCARILNCFMHLGMLEAIEIRMEIVSGNFRCLSISNCGFPAPDDSSKRGRGFRVGALLRTTCRRCSLSVWTRCTLAIGWPARAVVHAESGLCA